MDDDGDEVRLRHRALIKGWFLLFQYLPISIVDLFLGFEDGGGNDDRLIVGPGFILIERMDGWI